MHLFMSFFMQPALAEILLRSQPWNIQMTEHHPVLEKCIPVTMRTSAQHILKRHKLRPQKFLLSDGSVQTSMHCSGLAENSSHSWRGRVLGEQPVWVQTEPHSSWSLLARDPSVSYL